MRPTIAILIILLVLAVPFYHNVLKPAYFSYSLSCTQTTNEDLEKKGYTQAGVTKVRFNSTTNKTTVSIQVKENAKPDVLKHEYVHKIQFEKERVFPCKSSFFRYMNEVEAYSVQSLPDPIFIKLYGNYSSTQYTKDL